MKKNVFVVLIILTCSLLILVNINHFAFPKDVDSSDLLISHYPNALFVHDAVLRWKTIPLWSNTILSGYPLVANPLSGLWYFPGWLAFVTPSALGFNLLILIHLVFGGIGMFLWQRARGIGWLGSACALIMLMAMPKLLAHFAAGHISLAYSVCWTPWLMWSLVKFRQNSIRERKWWSSGAILAMIFLADVRWGAYATILALLYMVGLAVVVSPLGLIKSIARHSSRAIIIISTAIIIALPFLLLLLQFSTLSTRSNLTPLESFSYSLPFDKLLGGITPDFYGYAEWVFYPGALGILSLIYTIAVPEIRRKNWAWVALAIGSLIYSLGSNIPVLTELANIPFWGLLRVPPRVLFIWGISIAVLTAGVVDHLWKLGNLPKFDPFFFLVPMIVFEILLAGGVWFIEGKPVLNLVWGAIAFIVAGLLILLREKTWKKGHSWGIIVLLLIVVDLNGTNWKSMDFRSSEDVFSEKEELAVYMSDLSKDNFRVYSPSYSIPQHTAARYGFELADGIDPLQYRPYVEFMKDATGIPSSRYSVTLPSFENGDPATANTSYSPDPQLLGALNVKYIVSAYDIDALGLNLLQRVGTDRVYENIYFVPRVKMVNASNLIDVVGGVQNIQWTPNKILVDAAGPGLLVFSEINYPGWKVRIDDHEVDLIEVDGLFRGVFVGEGGHNIELRFSPWQLPIGVLVQGLALIAWFFFTKPTQRKNGENDDAR